MKLNKTYILLFIYILYFLSPVLSDNNLLDFNILQNLIYSIINIILIILILIFKLDIKIFSINKKLFTGIILFPLIISLSSLLNGNFLLLIKDLSGIINFYIFFFITIIIINVFSKDDLLLLIGKIIYVTAIIIIIIGFLQSYGLNIQGITGTNRPGSTLGNRTFASEYLASIFPIILFFFISEFNKSLINKSKILFHSLILVLFISYIIILRTRAAYICIIPTFLLFLVFLFIRNRQTYFKLTFGIISILILVASFFVGNLNIFKTDPERKDFGQNINSIFQLDYNTSRIEYMKASWIMFLNNPVSGIGTGNWFGYFPLTEKEISNKNIIIYGSKINDENVYLNSDLNSHNAYAEILSENGVIGILIFLWVFIIAVILLFKKSVIRDSYIPYLMCLINILVLFFFTFAKDSSVVMLIAFLTIALASNENKIVINKFKFNFSIKLIAAILCLPIMLIFIYNFLRYSSEKRYISALNYKARVDYISMNIELDKISNWIYPTDVNNMPLDYYRGVGYYEQKDYYNSLVLFRNAHTLTPGIALITNNLAAAYYKAGNIDSSKEIFLNLKNNFPNYIEPQINLLSLYANTRNYDSAKIIIKEIEEKEFKKEFVKNYSVFQQIKEFLK